MPFGSVLIARDDMDEEEIRWHLKTMKELGFNAIKQFMGSDRWPREELERLALEEGLVAWWYGEGGWEPPSPELSEKLGLESDLSIEEWRKHPKVLDHQMEVMKKRLGWKRIPLNPEQQAGFHDGNKQERPGARAFGADASLPEIVVPYFVEWLKETYENLDALNSAWNTDVMRGPNKGAFETWEQVAENNWVEAAREYGRVCDVLRFKADMKAKDVRQLGEIVKARNPYEPERSGGEMGLFLPFASRGTDMEQLADEMASRR